MTLLLQLHRISDVTDHADLVKANIPESTDLEFVKMVPAGQIGHAIGFSNFRLGL